MNRALILLITFISFVCFIVLIFFTFIAARASVLMGMDFMPVHVVRFELYNTDYIANVGYSRYRIYTSIGVFDNRDSFVKQKFNSADMQNSLYAFHESKKHLCVGTVYGFRNYWPFSLYPNVLTFHCD